MTSYREKMSYREIKEVVLDRIQKRIWLPDAMLPSEVDLAKEFSSTRTTVNRALRELAEEGYLERKRKAGTRVLNAPIRRAKFSIPLVRDEIAESGATYRYSLVDRKLLSAPSWLSARLSLNADQQVLHIRCMHYADSAPFQFENRWIVVDGVPTVVDADFSKFGPNDWLVQKVPFTNLELSFTATKADKIISEFLDTPAGDPVFTAERTTWLRNVPITFARLFFAPGYRMTTWL